VKNFDCKRDFLMIHHKDKYHSSLFEKFVFFSRKLMVKMIEEQQCAIDLAKELKKSS